MIKINYSISFLILILFLPLTSAINLEIKKTSSNEIMIRGLNSEVVFDLEITNNEQSGDFKIYNLVGFNILPTEKFYIDFGETKKIQLNISPIGEFNEKGYYSIQYFIRDKNSSDAKERLTFKIVELAEVFEIGSSEFNPESNSVKIYIKNKENFNFQKINAKFSSPFFSFDEEFALGPNQQKEFEIQVNKEDFNQLMAGFYTVNAEIKVENITADVEGIIEFVEKEIITTTKKEYGFIVFTKTIKKENKGNLLADTEVLINKNIISRLFTSFTPSPDIVERRGAIIYYTWNNQLKPGETLDIIVKTNWFFPFLIILFIVVIVILVKQYSNTNLLLRKRVSFVKTKGGEFALKITIILHTKQYIENVTIIDRLPQLVKLYEHFGGEQPTRVNEKEKKIEWKFKKLEVGEIRTLSYVIYSKMGVLGKFALPKAVAIYERNGNIDESESNRAFFVAEQKGKDVGEE